MQYIEMSRIDGQTVGLSLAGQSAGALRVCLRNITNFFAGQLDALDVVEAKP